MAEEQVAATKEERSTGRVVRFSDKKGFGFIKPDAGDKDLFVHHSAIKSDGGYRTLYEDDVVEFTILLTDDKYQAVDVTAPGGGPIKRRTTFSGGFNRRNSNTNGGGCFNCGNPGHIARECNNISSKSYNYNNNNNRGRLVEKDGPLKYNWEGYAELVQMVQKHGLKLQVVMSFHQCGGNVGDSCSIPLPPWVLEEMSKNHDLVYTDSSGRRNPEYISLGCDSLPLLRGRTPIQVYSDYMRSFRNRFQDYLGQVITEIQVGMGPCGELRYPAYPESKGTWKFPGIGEFQCYDKYMRASLEASAEAIGKTGWGQRGPHDSGQYNQFPEETGFFRRDGTWNTEYGQFFLEWYSGKLLEHGDKILAAAEGIFRGTGAKLSGKVAGIHWHYRTRSHAAELTAGYYNTRHHDGYLPMARMFSKYGAVFNFTCMEMRDGEQPEHANCSPEGLVRQVKMATGTAGTELAGENALERYDAGAFSQVMATSRSESGNGLSAFTYLRMNKRLLEGDNWLHLVQFVKSMSEGGRHGKLSECDSSGTNLYVGFIKDKSVHKTTEVALA